MSIYNEPPPGLFVVPDERDLTLIHALITGSFDTPYEGGFFYFLVRCPPDYPICPPKVKLMTTGGGSAVSYTHLDVYKRQTYDSVDMSLIIKYWLQTLWMTLS